MLKALTRDRAGRPALIIGLTDENWRMLESSLIQINGSEVGFDATVLIFKGRDQRHLRAKMVELGFADRSLLDLDDAVPDDARTWTAPQDRDQPQ